MKPRLKSTSRPVKAASPEIRGRSLLWSVVEEIGLRILNGTYAPSQSLPIEPELMAELRISRTVLREAIKILGAKGLIVSRPKSGTQVRPSRYWNLLDPVVLDLYCRVFDYSEFAQNFQKLRVIIEPEAAAMAAGQRNERHLRELEEAFAAMKAAKDIADWTSADLAFHEAILEATGNPFMQPLGSLIHAALNTLLFHSAETSANPFDSLRDHGSVLDAIRRRDAAAARQAMGRLLAGTGLSISKAVKSARHQSRRSGGRA
ncbi:MAG: FadR family transcriptional regulator [Alphaproteobacteria bacterium]|nr:FadR family transcriptional regulator [Alphaproteobacteria bacterium]